MSDLPPDERVEGEDLGVVPADLRFRASLAWTPVRPESLILLVGTVVLRFTAEGNVIYWGVTGGIQPQTGEIELVMIPSFAGHRVSASYMFDSEARPMRVPTSGQFVEAAAAAHFDQGGNGASWARLTMAEYGAIANGVLDQVRLTAQEERVLSHLAAAWNDFCALPPRHPSERQGMLDAMHAAQRIIAARVAARANPEVWTVLGHKPEKG